MFSTSLLALISAIWGVGCDPGGEDETIRPSHNPPQVDYDCLESEGADAEAFLEMVGLSPTTCGGGAVLWDGPLCGGDGKPCEILSQTAPGEISLGEQAYEVDLSLSPEGRVHLVYNGGFDSGYVGIDPGQSSPIYRPLPGLRKTAVAGGPGKGSFLLTAGDNPQLWYMDAGGGLTCIEAAPIHPDYIPSMVRDASGCLYVTQNAGDGTNRRVAFTRAPAWDGLFLEEDQGTVSKGVVALAPDGTPHTAFFHNNPTTRISWMVPEGRPETVVPEGVPLPKMAITLTSGIATPHFLLQGVGALEYYVRLSQGEWVAGVIEEARTEDDPCDYTPVEGDTCTEDRLEFEPLAVVVNAAGDSRLLYLKQRSLVELKGTCSGFRLGQASEPMQECYWIEGSREDFGQLMVAWLEDDGLERRPLNHDIFRARLQSSDSQSDASGVLHLGLVFCNEDVIYMALSL